VAPAAGAELHRPWFDFRAVEGSFYALEACGQKVGLIFRGLGTVEVRTPGPERSHTLHQEFSNLPGTLDLEQALFVGSDGAVEELLSGLPDGGEATGPFVDGPIPPAVYAVVQRRLGAFDPMKTSGGTARPAGEILWAPEPELGGVWADLELLGLQQRRTGENLEIRSAWLNYEWTERGGFGGAERGSWGRRSVGSTVGRDFGALPSEAAVGDDGSAFGLDQPPRPWNLKQADVSVFVKPTYTSDRNLDGMEGSATLHWVAREPQSRWLLLRLAEGQSQVFGDPWVPVNALGATAAFGDDEMAVVPMARVGNSLWIQLPRDPEPGDSVRTLVRWTGDVLEPAALGSIRPLAGWTWYPQPPAGDRHGLEIRLAAPKYWKAAATGRLLEVSDDGKYATRLFREIRPVLRGSLYLLDSRLEVLSPPSEGLPVLRIHRGSDTVKLNAEVGAQIYEHLTNLTALLGPFPYRELEIIEVGGASRISAGIIPVARFDSPPNQVQTSQVSGTTNLLGALTRQWLEADLGAFSHHDGWAVDGLAALAECFALIDAANPARCNGHMTGRRRQWRDTLSRQGQRWLAGPLWAAGASGWWFENNALRAPLVMQALRLQIGDEATRTLLGRLMTSYGGQSLRTESLVLQAQSIAAQDLRTFFYGWVYATPHDPVAELAWEAVQSDESTWALVVRGRLDAGRDADPLPMASPLLVRYDVDGKTYFQRLSLSHEERGFTINGLPGEPAKVVADPLKQFPGRVSLSP